MLKYNSKNSYIPIRRFSMSSSVSARALIVATLATGLPVSGAYAANECGTGTTVTCDSGPYTTGITYSNVTNLDLTVSGNTDVTGGVNLTPSTSTASNLSVNIDNGSGTIETRTAQKQGVDLEGAINIDTTNSAGGTFTGVMKSGTLVATGDSMSGVVMNSIGNTGPASNYSFDMQGGNIEINGSYSNGIVLWPGPPGSAQITMSGGTITGNAAPGTTRQAGIGLANNFAGPNDASTINITGGTITMNSAYSTAVMAVGEGSVSPSINLSGMTIVTNGDATGPGGVSDPSDTNGSAVSISNDGSAASILTMSSGSVTTTNSYAKGLHVVNYGRPSDTGKSTILLEGGTVTTAGVGAYGIFAYTLTDGDVLADIRDGTISTAGDGAHGVVAMSSSNDRLGGDATVDMRNGTITTKGAGSYGLYANNMSTLSGTDSTVNMYGGTITTGDSSDPSKGTGSHGVFAQSRGTGHAILNIGQQSAPLTIQTYGANAHGAYAHGFDTGVPANLSFQAGTISTAGDGAYGLAAFAESGDTELDYYQGTISTAGDAAYGLYAAAGGGAHGIFAKISSSSNTSDIVLNAHNTGITTNGDGSHGIYLQNLGQGAVTATFSGEDVNGSNIVTSGQGSHGIYLQASQGGSATFTGDLASLKTSGDDSYGLYVTNQDTAAGGNASIAYTSGHIAVSGKNSYGLYAEALGTGTADITTSWNGFASTVDVSGSGSYGVSAYSQGNTTTLSLDAATITATGNAQAAVGFAERASAGQAATQANITFGDSLVVDASGSGNKFAFYNADDQAGTNMNLTTTGTVTGSAVMGGGNSNFTLAGGSWTGNIYGDFDPNGTPAANQGVDNFVWSGGTLNSGFYGQGGNDTALISVAESPSFPNAILDGGEDGGAPESRISADFDQITFAANNSSLAGRNITNWEDFTVNENVALRFIDDGIAIDGHDGGNTNGFGDFNMLAGSKVTAGAGRGQSFNLGGNLVNQGVLSMQDGAYGGNITIGGDYDSKKGRLAIDVDFGALQSDVLTLGGKIDGVTAIDIADVGTSGALGSILLVDMTNSTSVDQNEFVIEDEKNNTTANGIYVYSMQYDLDGDPGNGLAPGLYLTSYDVPPPPPGPPGPTPPGPPGPTPPNPTPNIQPFVPLYEGYQSVLLEMNKLGTMRQRVGKRYWLYDAPMAAPVSIKSAPADTTPYQRPHDDTPDMQNLWARMDGGKSHVDPKSVTYDYKYDLSAFGIQTGLDGLFVDNDNGRLIGGLTAHYRDGEAKFDSVHGDSKMNVDGWGLGGTVTWYGDNGFYADGQAEATWYTSELKTEDLKYGVDNSKAFGYALSMETGKQIGLGDNMVLTPQGQLVWSSTDIDSFTGAYNDDVEFNKGNSLTARLGMALERENNWYEATGLSRHSNIYGIANVYYDFDAKTKTTIEQVYVAETDLGSWSGEIGFGGTYDWQDASKRNYGVYGEVSASMGFESGSYGYGGNVGFRLRW